MKNDKSKPPLVGKNLPLVTVLCNEPMDTGSFILDSNQESKLSKTATNFSASEAKKIKYLSTQDVLISVNNPREELFPLSIDRNSERVLTVTFDDVSCNCILSGQELRVIEGEVAKQIVDFAYKFRRSNFIIHCQAGVSRSAAIAMYLHIIYGHTLKEDFWATSRPNPYVLGKLMLVHSYMKHLGHIAQ